MNKNDNRDSKSFLAGMVIGVILAVVVGGCLIMTKIIKLEEEETVISDNNTDIVDSNETKITEVTFNGEKIVVSDIIRETIYVSSAGVTGKNYDYYADLKESGKVYVKAVDMQGNGNNYEEYLSNVSDVVDIVKFSVPAEPGEQLIYILQANGDVYCYKFGNASNNNFMAKKVDDVSNIKKLFIYNYPLNGALGGTWSIVGIKDNGETVEIRKEGV